LDEIVAFGPNVVHIQHEHSFFTSKNDHEESFFSLLRELGNKGIRTVVTLHTYDTSSFMDRLKNEVDMVVTTKAHPDLNGDAKIQAIHLPVENSVRIGTDEARKNINLGGRPCTIVGSFGMWNRHKGFKELLDTYNDVSMRIGSDVRYLLVGYRQPNNVYAQQVIRATKTMIDTKAVHLFTDFEPDLGSVVQKLCASNLLVFNYSVMAHSSASAALRTGMSAGRPIVCTHSSMFSEFEHEKHVVKVEFDNRDELVAAIMRVYNDRELAAHLVQNCDKFLHECTPEKIAHQHHVLYGKLLHGNEDENEGGTDDA
jgi:glycosyltransferase involved in cell wall biosynthesis